MPVFNDKPRSKDYIYCWYSRGGERKKASQHVRDQRHKLYSTGKFYDIIDDPLEQNDLAAKGVPKKWQKKHSRLKAALDKHVAATLKADPIQEARRTAVKRK